jgi:PAS domain S-box-containing protein
VRGFRGDPLDVRRGNRSASAWAFGGAYVVVAWLSSRLGTEAGVPLLLLEQGVAWAASQRFGAAAAPQLALAGAAAALVTGRPPAAIAVAAAIPAVVVLVGALLSRITRSVREGERIGDTAIRTGTTVLLSLAAASIGIAANAAGHDGPVSAAAFGALVLANFAGTTLVTPVVRAWLTRRSVGGAGPAERVLVLVFTLGLAALVFHGSFGSTGPSAYILFPPIAWAALRTGRLGVSTTMLGVGLTAAAATIAGRGPFSGPDPLSTLVVLDSFIAVLALTGLLLAGLEQARRVTETGLSTARRRHIQLLEQLPLVTYLRPAAPAAGLSYISPQVEQLLGYPVEDWLGDSPVAARVVHPDDVAIRKELAAAALAGEAVQGEYRVRSADGRIVWVLHQLVRVGDEVQGFVIDISERKQLEARLARAQRTESLGLLAGGIAHDFNNLLTAISGYTALALGRVGESDAVLTSNLREVSAAAGRAAELTRQLLAFGRRQQLDPTAVDLNAVVRESHGLLARVLGDDVEVRTELDPSVAAVRADAGQLGQVVMNLALNARDAMPGGGTLTLRTWNDGDRVALSVADTGVGMDDGTRARIFEPFFTTKAVGAGTGLGLSVVDGIVQQTGGEIAVSSAPGSGTEITVRLPRTTAAAAPRVVEETAPPPGTETVLLVEDQDVVRRLASRLLVEHGYRVLEASTPADALALDDDWDLLLSDVVMPGMSGPELAEALAERRPGAAVLFMSGYTGAAVGAAELPGPLLGKPFTPSELACAVREALDARRAALAA